MTMTDCGRCLAARATHASHRARILGLGLSVGIAIALSGCTPPSMRGSADASDVAFSTVTMDANESDYPKAKAAAREALSDGRVTNDEYNRVIAISNAYKAKACSLAKRAAVEAARGRRAISDVADVQDVCEFGIIYTEKGIYLYADWPRFASGMPPREDPKGLRPKAGSPTAEGGDAQTPTP